MIQVSEVWWQASREKQDASWSRQQGLCWSIHCAEKNEREVLCQNLLNKNEFSRIHVSNSDFDSEELLKTTRQ